MKHILIIWGLVLTSTFAQAQTEINECPDKAWFITLKDKLDNPNYRQEIKELRQWARENDRAEYENISNKLEYWVKDTSRYIDKYLDSNYDAVCKRILVDDIHYLADFAIVIIYPESMIPSYLNDLSHYK